MRTLVILAICIFCSVSCAKQQADYMATDPVLATCFKARFVGEGCLPVIQVLNGKGFMLNSKWQAMTAGSLPYDTTVTVTELPAKYRDGNMFYFTASGVDSTIVHVMNCNTPKYVLTINRFSDSSCAVSNH